MRWTLIVVIAAAATKLVMGQAERGSIRGTIQDASGAVTPLARITAIHAATAVRSFTVSTEAGVYSIPQLSPGTYTIEAEKAGFKRLVRRNVYVEVAGVVSLDLVLEVGEITQSVTVTEAAPQLKADTSDVNTSVNARTYMDLPLSIEGGGVAGGRNPGAFVFLVPGVVGNTFNTSTNGSQVFSEEIQIDGISLQTAVHTMARQELSLSPDAVQEFSVSTHGYTAEYGAVQGGVQRYTVRSGTNEFHGNVYEYLRNDKLDTRGFFVPRRSINKKNEFGGSIGGPIILPRLYDGRNRSFFFGNGNLFKFRSGPANSLGSVPPPAFIQGDLSALLLPENGRIQIYDPATTRPDGQGGFVRDPFAGNIIPQNRFSSVSRKINAFFPAPNRPGLVNNFISSEIGRADTETAAVKIDHLFSSNHRISGTFNWGENTPRGAAQYPFPFQPTFPF